MALCSLLFTRDQEIVKLAGEVLTMLDIKVSQCSEVQEALRRLTDTKFDAIIVDNADAPSAVAVLSAAKSLPSCEQSVGIVLAVSTTSLGLADGAGSHMVLYRPLSADRLRNGVRSALGLMRQGKDTRASQRTPFNIPATLRGAGLDDTLVFITNLSVGGAALDVGRSVPSPSIHSIEFSLPDMKGNFTTSVELVWRDVQGHVGLRFTSMPTTFRESLEKWLVSRLASQRASKTGA